MNIECKNVAGEKISAAILLIGPTGAGKTPLGEFLVECGFWGHRCLHFDFGANLRLVAEGGAGLPDSDVETVRGVLSTGMLLENDQFAIAERILRSFVERSRGAEGDLVVLNGLPRHVDQAADVDRLVDVVSVISLECGADIVYDRIRANSGGDRAERNDDAVHAIAATSRII